MRAIVVAVSFLSCLLLAGEHAPPNPYIDNPACPFEGCQYGEWVALKPKRLVDRPLGTHVVAQLRPGDKVQALTGEVRSIPVRVVASHDDPDPYDPETVMIHKGEAFYVLHYVGEGNWLVWFRGKLTFVENMSDQAPVPKADWWVRFKTKDGVVGWAITEGSDFSGLDRLA